MIKSFLTHSQVIQGEPALDDYLRSDQINFDSIRLEAFSDMFKDLIDQNLDMKKMCLPLPLQTSVTKTDAFEGTITDEDFAQRTRLELKVTALTGTAVFTIEGTNDETTYEVIDIISGGSIVSSIAVTETGTYDYILTGVYEYYRFNVISTTSVTYSAGLYENTYTILHRDLTRKKIYGSLMAEQGDVWAGKYQYYRDVYDLELKTSKFYYDSDDSGQYSETESEKNLNVNVSFRP